MIGSTAWRIEIAKCARYKDRAIASLGKCYVRTIADFGKA